MQTSLGLDIRRHLDRYLSGETSLSEFDAWFVPATWDVGREADPWSYDLTNEIYLRLAEYANGHWTEDELKDRLRQVIEVPATAT